MNFVYNFHCCCCINAKIFVEMESFFVAVLFLPPCGLYGFVKKIVLEEQMFFENTNLDFLDKRYPFKDITQDKKHEGDPYEHPT